MPERQSWMACFDDLVALHSSSSNILALSNDHDKHLPWTTCILFFGKFSVMGFWILLYRWSSCPASGIFAVWFQHSGLLDMCVQIKFKSWTHEVQGDCLPYRFFQIPKRLSPTPCISWNSTIDVPTFSRKSAARRVFFPMSTNRCYRKWPTS